MNVKLLSMFVQLRESCVVCSCTSWVAKQNGVKKSTKLATMKATRHKTSWFPIKCHFISIRSENETKLLFRDDVLPIGFSIIDNNNNNKKFTWKLNLLQYKSTTNCRCSIEMHSFESKSAFFFFFALFISSSTADQWLMSMSAQLFFLFFASRWRI